MSCPPYYPVDDVLREDWATYLNSILNLDQEVKRVVERLDTDCNCKASCLAENQEKAWQILVDSIDNSNRISGMYSASFIEGLLLPMIEKNGSAAS